MKWAIPSLLLLLSAIPSAARAAAPPRPAGEAPAADRAAFQFTYAKMLAAEGSFEEALAAFDEAARLAPGDPYVRIEKAELLARLGQGARSPRARADYLARAGEEAKKARDLAALSDHPDHSDHLVPGVSTSSAYTDVLRGVGEVYLELAQQTPAAMATAQESFEALRQRDPSDLQAMVTLGRIYLDKGEPAKAAEVFRQLITYIPNNPMASSLLVESLLKADRKEEAEGVLKEMLEQEPGSLETRLTLAEVQGQRGNHRAALDTLLAAPEAVRSDPQLRRQLASALYLTGDLDSALATADSLLQAQPDNQYLALLKGLILTAEGRNEEALQLLSKLREAEPQDLVLAATVARVLRREGRKDEAAKLLGDLAQSLAREGKEKESREARFELAQLYFTTEDWQRVADVLAPLLASTDPAIRTEALLLQADALVSLKRYDQALELLGPAAAGSPLVAGKEAEVLYRAGKERQARRQLAKLARAEDPQAVLAAVQAYQRLEQYSESIPLLKGLLTTRPKLAPAGFLLGAAYERTGQREQAVAAFRQVLKIDPDFHSALNYLGYMWAEKGENLNEALSLVKRAVALDPDNGAYVDSLGWTHFRLGQYDRARDFLERATRLVPEDATVHEHLGDVYLALGQTAKAREMYERALQLGDPNPEHLRRKLNGLPEATPRR
ncbi:MAG TPA: tetratricopeptide repeat protein [Thermoanaerobaculia bacterium]|nr:tetratricopeptide repeat protein [Thermoanaerobaculia bacterium]